MNRGKRRRRRATFEPSESSKAKRQQRRRKGFRISKRATKRRTEASAPRPSIRDPFAQKRPDPTTTPPLDYSTNTPKEQPEPKVVPEATDIKAQSTIRQRGSRIRTIRPKTLAVPPRPPPPPVSPVSEPEEDEPQDSIPKATYMAKKLGHQLNSWETAPGGEKGRDENHYTTCKVCGRKARATLEPLEGYPDNESTWRYTGGALINPCER